MNCSIAKDFIQSSVDGGLTLDERQGLDKHLESCVACRVEWEAQRRLAQMADRWARPTPADDPGEAFTAAVLAQIAARPKTAPRSAASASYTFWMPLAALLCLGAAAALLPAVSLPDLRPLALAGQQLPQWLLSNLQALSAEASALAHTPPSYVVPHYTWAILLLVIALNSAFCVHARRGQAQRSFS